MKHLPSILCALFAFLGFSETTDAAERDLRPATDQNSGKDSEAKNTETASESQSSENVLSSMKLDPEDAAKIPATRATGYDDHSDSVEENRVSL